MHAEATALARTPLFAGLAPAVLDEIYRQMTPRHVAAREVICHAGEPGDSLFVIQHGLAQVTVGGAGGEAASAATAPVARLRRGDVVGELSLVSGEPRSATVIAMVPTAMLELSRDRFAAVLARHPAVLTNLTRILSERLARTTARRAASARRGEAIALLADRRGLAFLPAALAAARTASPRTVAALDLTASLPAEGHDVTLDERTVAGTLGVLDDLLAEHGLVIVATTADQENLPLLLEQMDRIVALLAEEESERLAVLPGPLAERVEVVLLARVDRPGVVPATVAGRRVIHACDPDQPGQDLAWLGRHLARTKLGLALGAGGAKGYAHVATLQVLEAAGYTVDYVSGSSIGAMVGSWLALGLSATAIEGLMRDAFSPETVSTMFKLSLTGMSSGLDAHTRVCRETTGERSFDDLQIPLVVMTVDLTTRQPATITEGPLWEALLAATALPGMFPPQQRGEQRLVDGLALVPVPVDAVREAGADIVLAVNIMSRDTLPAWPGDQPPAPPPARSGSRMLDTLLEVMDLSQLDASVRHAARADVVVTPRFGPATWRDFHLADLFLAAGREAAEEQLATLRALTNPHAPSLAIPAV